MPSGSTAAPTSAELGARRGTLGDGGGRDHRTGDDPIEQAWFMVKKLYLTPFRGRVIERHSNQFFYATGTTSNAQVHAISRGEQSPGAAHITWTGMATYGGSAAPAASKTCP